ncbi:MAG: hypothetical protein HYV04_06765 [Deltaproteobacteria bacterium]|nr:hypothetical protein [Deltaproteobacteria bacterium]
MLKKILLGILAGIILVPSVSFADHPGRWPRHRYGYYRPNRVVVRNHYDYNGAAIAAGVLGGIATGIILDRVLVSPPPPPQPVYSPPPPPRRDPYDYGYSDGYDQGVRRGSQERYEQGRTRGYEEGYEDARAGKAY